MSDVENFLAESRQPEGQQQVDTRQLRWSASGRGSQQQPSLGPPSYSSVRIVYSPQAALA